MINQQCHIEISDEKATEIMETALRNALSYDNVVDFMRATKLNTLHLLMLLEYVQCQRLQGKVIKFVDKEERK